MAANNQEITLEQLEKMKKMALKMNNLGEVERINKIIALKLGNRKIIKKGRKPKLLENLM